MCFTVCMYIHMYVSRRATDFVYSVVVLKCMSYNLKYIFYCKLNYDMEIMNIHVI